MWPLTKRKRRITNRQSSELAIPAMTSFGTLTPNLSTPTTPRISQIPNPIPLFRNSFAFSHSNYPQFTTVTSPTLRHCLSPLNASSSSSSSSSEFPLLPFSTSEVLVPSESKTLHLYEARFLSLLEESLTRKNKLFVHFVLDPIFTASSSAGGVTLAARYCCLAQIENVRRLDVGALVSIRGISRVRVVDFIQTEPYWKGVVMPLQDDIPESVGEINTKVTELKEALNSLNQLQIKLKAPKDEVLQTPIANSLRWAERDLSIGCDESFLPGSSELLSFAGFQPVTGSSQSELLALQKEKLQGMTIRDTSKRLENSIQYIRQCISLVAAKLAIQSLEAK